MKTDANGPNARDLLLSVPDHRVIPPAQWLHVIAAMTRYIRPSSHLWAVNTAPIALRSAYSRLSDLGRAYATYSDLGRGPNTSAKPARKNITVLSDDGRLQWGELSGKEKVSRATQQSFNFVVVLAGAVLTVCQTNSGI